jgi:hypothetical protein
MPEQEMNPRRRRASQLSLIITIFVVALAAAGGYWAWDNYIRFDEPAQVEDTVIETPPAPTTATYASSTMRFTLSYPTSFMLEEAYAYTAFEGKPISGVKLRVPPAFTSGTNLAADSGISVEQLPRANSCTADIYLLANVRAASVTEGATTYSVASSTTATGGESVEEIVYAFPQSKPCIAVRYFLHSSAAGTSTAPFDRAAVIAAFDEIRRSIAVQ